ncbi:translesion DNA synthesis-associated protein ImuA [Methylomonas sp. UP202]|uniref:translesion DNA synthesis-associated protein ImuA n=1 Tax=Methylomonas sp. UP202 TaxID=3040943 RepID=UPI00247AC87F|nr:translesion DNA synthesis-associated protein ImuA [Methylomonas sp. UP202]WGS88133.1 translesion DNA synthesis-associated protein ImuA [Methylomonas sp. UP202]
MKPALEQLLRGQDQVWRGLQTDSASGIATGFAELDALLPGGGWPNGALMHWQLPHIGIGELPLLLPAMAALSRQGQRIVWLAPPYQAYAPGLQQAGVELGQLLVVTCPEAADLPWALEVLLRSGGCGMALAWPKRPLAAHQTRRLQLAAEAGNALAVLFAVGHAAQARHAALQLALRRESGGLRLRIAKARGSLRQLDLLLAI